MRRSHVFVGVFFVFALSFATAGSRAQQPTPSPSPAPQQQKPQEPKKPTTDSALSRLTGAKSVMVSRERGSPIPYDVISSTVDGWGRFTMVDTADKADLVITVATTGGDSPVKGSTSGPVSPLAGRPERSAGGGVEFSNAEITMTVYDARNKRILWTAVETAKSAMKQTARENNLVEAAEKLASKFHDRIEPPPPKEKEQD